MQPLDFTNLASRSFCSVRVRRVIVVVIIPVAIRVPAITVGVPPAVVVFPAVFAGFCEFVSRMRGLLALVTVMLDSLV